MSTIWDHLYAPPKVTNALPSASRQQATTPPLRLSTTLEQNIQLFETLFHSPRNNDFMLRRITPHGVPMAVLYIDGMAKRAGIEDMVLRPLMEMRAFGELSASLRALALSENILPTGTSKLCDDPIEIAQFLLGGNCAVLIDGCAQAVMNESQGFATRGVGNPQNENVTMGAHEAFNESIRTNITLLRRLVRSENLITEMVKVGQITQTTVAVVYLENVANPAIVHRVKDRLSGIRTGGLLSAGQLQQLLEDRPMNLLPQIVQTERPDRASSFLLDGMVLLLCDNAPYALGAPATIWHFVHTSDDHELKWQYGTFNRLVRLLGCLLTLLLPAVYNALLLFHQELIPTDLLTSILEGYTMVPLSVTVELILLDLLFDLINEASLRMPGSMGSTLGIVGGLVLGQAAVSAKLISPTLIIVVSITGLGLFAVPSYPLSLAIRISRLALLIVSAFSGLVGVALFGMLLAASACALTSFGVPYFSPLSPASRHNPDLITRMPIGSQTVVPASMHPRRATAASAPRGWTHKPDPKE